MSKEVFVEHLEKLLPEKGARILELGSGKSLAVAKLLQRRPDIRYTGIEPSRDAHEYAKKGIGNLPNVRLVNALAYEVGEESSYDLCFSLSVLEHVKHLDRFLRESVKSVRSGGYVVHRYDLGHALSPSSLKERFQVILGNTVPFVLPEDKFVRYVDQDEVIELLSDNSALTERVTYHQMPQHKILFNNLNESPEKDEFVRRVAEWDFDISPSLLTLPKKKRESLFHAIAVWARKK